MPKPVEQLYFICCFLTGAILFVNSQGCRTPDEKQGACVDIKYCPSLFKLSQGGSGPDEIFLLLSRCVDDSLKYCCENLTDEIIFETDPDSKVGVKSPVSGERCKTPDDQEGQCIELQDCPPLVNMLKQGSFTVAKQTYLRERMCGFAGRNAKACCVMEAEGPAGRIFENGLTGPISSDLLPDKSVCGLGLDDRIKGGSKAGLFEFPWMALLSYQSSAETKFLCGGVLISKKYVLTAAHCVANSEISKTFKLTSVRLGEYDTDKSIDCDGDACNNPIDVNIEEEMVNEDYNPSDKSQHNDIALLRLASDVTFTAYIKPICLPTTPELRSRDYIGSIATVAGWGKTETRSESNILLKVQLTVKPIGDCKILYRSKTTLHPGQICAGGDLNKDSCRGDSGGPLMTPRNITTINTYAIGVVSFGVANCETSNIPGVYTSVSYYMPWIVSKLRP